MLVASSQESKAERGRTTDRTDSHGSLVRVIYRGLRSELHRHSGSLSGHVYLDINAVVRDVLATNSSGDLSDYRRRARLLSVTAAAIRRVLVEQARACQVRRGPITAEDSARLTNGSRLDVTHAGESGRVYFDRSTVASIIELDDALNRLSRARPRLVEVAQCVIFGRMSCSEIAAGLDLTCKAVKGAWSVAQVCVHRLTDNTHDEPPMDGGP